MILSSSIGKYTEVNLSQFSVKYGIKCLQSGAFCIKIVKVFRGGGMPPDPPSLKNAGSARSFLELPYNLFPAEARI